MRLYRYPFFSLLAGLCSASAAAAPYLYVENGQTGDVAVISIPEHEVVGTFEVGAGTDDVIGSPDGRIAYVNRGIDSGHGLGFPETGEVVAVSTYDDSILWRLPIDDGWPHHMSISEDGRHLYMPLFDEPYVIVIDTEKRTISDRLDILWGGHGTRLAPDGKHLYVGSILTQSLYVVNTEDNSLANIFNFPDGVRPFAFDRAETRLYTQLSRLHGFTVTDLESGDILQTVELPGLPDDFGPPEAFPHNVNHGLELSPDEKYLLAAGSIINMVAIYSHPELELRKTIEVGHDPNWIVFSPDGRFAYVSNRGANNVSVISLESLSEVKRVDTQGKAPARMRVIDVPKRKARG